MNNFVRNAVVIVAAGFLPLMSAVSGCGGPAAGEAKQVAAKSAEVPAAALAAVAVQRGAVSEPAEHSDLSAPLTLLPPAPRATGNIEHPVKPIPRHFNRAPTADPVLQSAAVSPLAPTPLLSFNGVGNGFTGPAGAFTVAAAPPDTNGDVGPNHYVQTVNTDFAVFNKSGTAIFGPVPLNTLWSGFGGGCQTNNDGDPVVVYDSIADRWVISQFSVSTTPDLQCVAVSQTGDPTGAYFRYSFQYANFPDYPKMGVWPDAYYVTFNTFSNATNAFLGAQICAYDRAKMLIGAAATQQCFNTSTSFGGLLPSDLDGARLPPAGAPNYIVGMGAAANQLAFWKFHVDFATPANSTFTGPATLATAAFAEACAGGTCIPQSGTVQKLDSLADRLMFRLAYRNFGDHQALVTNHSITAGSSTGVRWYELRPDAANNLSIFQQGTYAPDANFRWMGSIAQDQSGNAALGFSISSSTLHPEIHYTGRLAADAAGTMTQGESSIIDGAGSQTGQSLSRWGDYSNMVVDPVDDCTFWYTTEYIPANGAFNWSTRIGSFKLPGCGAAAANDFSISASPATVSIAAGSSGTTTIGTATIAGAAQTVSLTASGAPAGVTASFSPASVTSGGSSTLTIATTAAAAAGTFTLTITGTGTSATHATTVSVTVTTTPANDFSISASPASLSIAAGSSGTATIGTATTSGTAQTVSLSVSGAPAGVTASVSPASVTSGGSSTLTVATAATAAAGTFTLTITGTAASGSHTTTVSVTITTTAGTCTTSSQLFGNPGFESGNTIWTASAAVIDGSTAGSAPRTGVFKAWLDGYGTTHTDTLLQTVTIPAAACSASLSFWLKITTSETTTTTAFDKLTVTVRNAAGTVLSTLATYSNLNKSTTYLQKTFDLTAFKGQTVRIEFVGTEDVSLQTSFFVDDTALTVTQ